MEAVHTQDRYELTVGQVAEMLDVDPSTVRRWARSGRIDHWLTPGGRVKFRPSDVAALLKNHYPTAEGPAA